MALNTTTPDMEKRPIRDSMQSCRRFKMLCCKQNIAPWSLSFLNINHLLFPSSVNNNVFKVFAKMQMLGDMVNTNLMIVCTQACTLAFLSQSHIFSNIFGHLWWWWLNWRSFIRALQSSNCETLSMEKKWDFFFFTSGASGKKSCANSKDPKGQKVKDTQLWWKQSLQLQNTTYICISQEHLAAVRAQKLWLLCTYCILSLFPQKKLYLHLSTC